MKPIEFHRRKAPLIWVPIDVFFQLIPLNRPGREFGFRLPRCETFSYGLLVWEILKHGASYYDRAWLTQTSSRTGESEEQGKPFGGLGRDGLLEKCRQYVFSMSSISRLEKTTFSLVFGWTLADRAERRKDMQTVCCNIRGND